MTYVPAAGGGALTKISTITLGANAANITFSSIPQGYSALQVELWARSTVSAATDNLWMTVNGDSGANYNWEYTTFPTATGSVTVTTQAGSSSFVGGSIPANTASAGLLGRAQLRLASYADTSGNCKSCDFMSFTHTSTTSATGYVAMLGTGVWKTTNTAITSLSLLCNGNFVTMSRASLYGLAS